MPRSLKKGPYINYKLYKKLMENTSKKNIIKTWFRSSTISPDFVGFTIAINNGRQFIPITITENMVGHKLGEFSPTRVFRSHSFSKKKK